MSQEVDEEGAEALRARIAELEREVRNQDNLLEMYRSAIERVVLTTDALRDEVSLLRMRSDLAFAGFAFGTGSEACVAMMMLWDEHLAEQARRRAECGMAPHGSEGT